MLLESTRWRDVGWRKGFPLLNVHSHEYFKRKTLKPFLTANSAARLLALSPFSLSPPIMQKGVKENFFNSLLFTSSNP